jgi:hypothetical protein
MEAHSSLERVVDEYTVVLAGGRTRKITNVEEIALVETQALGHRQPEVFFHELMRLLRQSDRERRHARRRAKTR